MESNFMLTLFQGVLADGKTGTREGVIGSVAPEMMVNRVRMMKIGLRKRPGVKPILFLPIWLK